VTEYKLNLTEHHGAEALRCIAVALADALRRVEWTAEDVNDAHGATFCPECGGHQQGCPCDGCDDDDVPPGHIDSCRLAAALTQARAAGVAS